MKTLLFFGDSLTAGYGLSDVENQSFPGLIQKKIEAGRLDFQVINGGVSGDTSGGGLGRIDYWISRKIDVFVLELGINDIMRGIPPLTTTANLQQIINRVKSKCPDCAMAMMGMQLPDFIPGAQTVEFRALFKTLADKNQMALVPFFLEGVAGQQNLNLQDGLHPSAQGYKVIADKVWPVLEPLLKRNS